MHLTSVNVGHKQALRIGGRETNTGIFKQPVEGAVQVTSLGLAGDAIVSRKHHGGPDQAVYVYTAQDYAWWSERLGRELGPGTFGENLTVSGVESATLRIGDRLHFGEEVVLEVTSPRIPCMTLESRMEMRGFAKQFRDAERPGFYCRVIREGEVQAGDAARLEPFEGETVSLIEVYRDFYEPKLEEPAIRRILSAPIAVRARKHKEKQLAALTTGKSPTLSA
jgi:MOSC domain-containing protein YiiM